MTVSAGLLPWYERGPDGTATGRDWPTEDQARAEVGPECTVHQETSDLAGLLHPGTTRYTRPAPTTPARGWKPRGFGGTD